MRKGQQQGIVSHWHFFAKLLAFCFFSVFLQVVIIPMTEGRAFADEKICVHYKYVHEGGSRKTNRMCYSIVDEKVDVKNPSKRSSENYVFTISNVGFWSSISDITVRYLYASDAENYSPPHPIVDFDQNNISVDDFKLLVNKSAGDFTSRCKSYGLTVSSVEVVFDDGSSSGNGDDDGDDDEGFHWGDDSKKNNVCYAKSGALGWIICPVVTGISGIGEYMWNQIETYHLKIPASEIFAENSGVRNAWGVVRNIANILFILLFMFVIFSQLTGVGIDNYGIKKILPKLVVVAVLVNLSYIICELAVDASNIFGVGLNDLLSSAAGDIDLGAPAGIASQATGGVALLALVGAGAWLYTLLPLGVIGLGLAVLGLVITIVTSMFFLYLVLVIREAGVILMVVAAPVALVCYMLPNTEKYYKKWFELFKAVLIVYPLCGAIVGGGKLAGAVLSTIDQPSMKVAAMLVQVLPFFLIPMLLRSSLSAMGNVGAKITSWGKSMGRRGSTAAQGAIRNTNFVKNRQEMNAENRIRSLAGLDKKGNVRNLNSLQKLVRGGERNIARARIQYAKNTEMREREAEMMKNGFASTMAGVEAKVDAQRVSDYEALINNGKIKLGNGNDVNANDPGSVGNYHMEALGRYNNATTDADRTEAMAEIKAAQNILSKTDKGRTQVETNLGNMLRSGSLTASGQKGLTAAASHLLSNYGDKYKAVNRGAHSMISDLATTDLTNGSNLSTLQGKLIGDVYRFGGTDKYTAEALANADESVLDNFVSGVSSGALTGVELSNIQETAYKALQNAKSGNLNIKPEVTRRLEQIAGDYGVRHPDHASQDRQRQVDMARDLNEINRRLRGGRGRGRP